MSITAELRQYTKHYSVAGSKKDTMLSSIADRIDAEHESKISRAAQLLADAEKDRDFNYANWQDCKQKVLQHDITMDELDAEIERLKDGLARCIALPVDADGEYIHIGDVMETVGGKRFEVRFLTLTESEWTVNSEGWFTERLRHHHAPTVEDVLEELLREYDRDDSELTNGEIIERFAAKLRLAGDAE